MAGNHDGALVVSVNSPAIDGKANEDVIAVLSEALQIPKKLISIKSGLNSRRKLIAVNSNAVEIEKMVDKLKELK